MRIGLIGGIFGKPSEYRSVVTHTPETVLSAGLRARGHEVCEYGHRAVVDVTRFDVVHVHHLGLGALAVAGARPATTFAFTSHSGPTPLGRRWAAMRYVMARAAGVVALSSAEAQWQRRAQPAISDRQYVIPNGIDETVFHHRPPPLPPAEGEPWRLLYVGQLVALKGVGHLLRAMARLSSDFEVELDLAYHVATDERALRTQVDGLGLRGVRFLGPKSAGQLAELYGSCHALALPSLTEALPSAVSEALVVGRPVVASDVGAVREQVGDFGEVVPPGDSEALAAGVARLLGDYLRYADRADDVSRAAALRYSTAAMVGAHERLYEALRDPPARRSLARSADAVVRACLPAARRHRVG